MEHVKELNSTEEERNNSQPDNTMVYTLAHDIKSPINHVKGLLTIARRLNKDEEVEHFLRMALEANTHLTEKVNDLLDMNIREKEQVCIDLRGLVKEIWDDVREVRGEHDMKMIHLCQVESDIRADKTRLTSILQNLMENAVKYQKKGNDSSLVVRSLIFGNLIHIKVIDNGIGMSQEQEDRLFQANFQADNRCEGHGMGMYLARKNARHMGGELMADSTPGAGTTFTLILPFVV